MKKRKRAAGGGRKRKTGPDRTVPVGIRLPERLLAQLHGAAARRRNQSNWNFSQEIISRLDKSFRIRRDKRLWERAVGAPYNIAFGQTVAELAWRIEQNTGESWQTDAWTFNELKAAIEWTLSHKLSPGGPSKLPAKIEKSAADLPPRYRKQYCQPRGVGFTVAAGFWHQLETLERSPLPERENDYYAPSFYKMPELRKALGFKRRGESAGEKSRPQARRVLRSSPLTQK